MIRADTCIRCEKAKPELGSFLCATCQSALTTPQPERPTQGKPVAKRMSPFHKQRPDGWPR